MWHNILHTMNNELNGGEGGSRRSIATIIIHENLLSFVTMISEMRKLVIAILMLPAAVCAVASTGNIDHLKRGDAYYNGRSLGKAITEYKLVLRQEPESYRAYYMLANSYYLMGDRARALLAYKEVVRIRPDEEEIVAFVRKLIEQEGIIDAEATLDLEPEPSPTPESVLGSAGEDSLALPELPLDNGAAALPQELPEIPAGEEASVDEEIGVFELPLAEERAQDTALSEILAAENAGEVAATELPADDTSVLPLPGVSPAAVAVVEEDAGVVAPPLPEVEAGPVLPDDAAGEPAMIDIDQLLADSEGPSPEPQTEPAGLGWQEHEVISSDNDTERESAALAIEDGLPDFADDLQGLPEELGDVEEFPAVTADEAQGSAPEAEVPASDLSTAEQGVTAGEEELDLESLLDELD